MVQETPAMRPTRPAGFGDPGSNPPPFHKRPGSGTWRARAAAARVGLAMGRLPERGAAESGGGTQRTAGRESGRRGQAPAHGLRGAGCHHRGPGARARRRERRSPSSIPGGGASTGLVLLSLQWVKPKPSSPPPGPGLGHESARRKRAPFQMQALQEHPYLPNNLGKWPGNAPRPRRRRRGN